MSLKKMQLAFDGLEFLKFESLKKNGKATYLNVKWWGPGFMSNVEALYQNSGSIWVYDNTVKHIENHFNHKDIYYPLKIKKNHAVV